MGKSQSRTWAPNLTIDWSEEGEQKLRRSILQKKRKNGRTIAPRILVFGPSSAGKSSLCNGIKSAFEEQNNVSTYFSVGSVQDSFTRNFQRLHNEHFQFWDMPGVFESKDFKNEDIQAIIRGEVSFSEEITKHLHVQVNQDSESERNSVECVLIVISICLEVGQEIRRMIKCIMELSGYGWITYRLVLTHVDELDNTFRTPKYLTGIFDSTAVQDAVVKMGKSTGIPLNRISVVRNYSREMKTDRHSNILFLHTLETILDSTYEQVQLKSTQQSG